MSRNAGLAKNLLKEFPVKEVRKIFEDNGLKVTPEVEEVLTDFSKKANLALSLMFRGMPPSEVRETFRENGIIITEEAEEVLQHAEERTLS